MRDAASDATSDRGVVVYQYYDAVKSLEDFARAIGREYFIRGVQRVLCANTWRPKRWWLVPTRYELVEMSRAGGALPPGWERIHV